MGSNKVKAMKNLQRAYRQTIYRVSDGKQSFDLMIDQKHSQFDDYCLQASINSWAIITAYNPGAIALSDAENRIANQKLLNQIKALGLIER